jgi:hypothetical protein
MKQIAVAMIMYINDNKGRFPPCLCNETGVSATNPYPDGFFWAAELVHQKYINAPNIFKNGGTTKVFDQPSVFLCPEGLTADDWAGSSGTGSANQGLWPTDPKNNSFVWGIAQNPRLDGQTPYGVATWYQVNSRVSGNLSSAFPGGAFNPPFVYFDSSKDGVAPATAPGMAGQLSAPGYQRSQGCVKNSAVLVMLVEAASVNWVDQTLHTRNGEDMYVTRMGARHGQISSNGNNAYDNFAFFDGHVALMPTKPIEDTVGGLPKVYPASGTVFILTNQ